MKKLFRFVLILTFIGSGSSALSMLMMPAMKPMIRAILESGQLSSMPMGAGVVGAYEQMLAWPAYYYYAMGVLYALSVVGAVAMWRMRRSGLHMYAVAQLLLLLVPVLLLGKEMFDLGGAMITLCFIVFYYSAMKQLSATEEVATQQVAVEAEPDDDEEEEEDDDD